MAVAVVVAEVAAGVVGEDEDEDEDEEDDALFMNFPSMLEDRFGLAEADAGDVCEDDGD